MIKNIISKYRSRSVRSLRHLSRFVTLSLLVGSTPSAWALHVPFVATTVMESRTYGGFAPSQELDVRLLTNGDVIVAQGGSQKVVGQLPKSRVREIQKTIEGLREEKLMLENPNAVGCQDAPSTTYIAYTEEGLSVRLGERINCLLTRNMDFQGSKLLDVLFGLEKMAAL